MPITDQTVMPTQGDVLLAQQSSRLLGSLKVPENRSMGIQVGSQIVEVPGMLSAVLLEALAKIAEGKAVTVTSIEEESSPQEAAELLNVSRPYAAKLFDDGSIPSRRVGTHRRALTRDVLAYKEREKQARLKTLAELSAHDQSLNMGY